jgi:hypothetical protein
MEQELYRSVWLGSYEQFSWFTSTVTSRDVEAEFGGRPTVAQYVRSLGIAFHDCPQGFDEADSELTELLQLVSSTLQRLCLLSEGLSLTSSEQMSARGHLQTISLICSFSSLSECSVLASAPFHPFIYEFLPNLQRSALYRHTISEQSALHLTDVAVSTSPCRLRELFFIDPIFSDTCDNTTGTLTPLVLLLLNIPSLRKIVLLVRCDALHPVTCFRLAARFRKSLQLTRLPAGFEDRIFVSEMITRHPALQWMSTTIGDGTLWNQEQINIKKWIKRYPVKSGSWDLDIMEL